MARERLTFVLAEFTRYTWASEAARTVWEPRHARIQHAWRDVEWLSAAEGVRDCALLWMPPDDLPELIPRWESRELSAVQLQIEDSFFGANAAPSPASVSGLLCVTVGALDKVERLRRAWVASDDEAIGSLLGYPACCRDFFRRVWNEQRCLDTTWAMAENMSPSHVDGTIRIELPEAVPPLANILWRWFGVRAVPHLPCRFDCPASIEFGKRLLDVGRRAGYAEEVGWVEEILSWPAEWSALHGIAEVKSPLMKLSTRTDATTGRWAVQWVGTTYPAEGAVGLHFPYQPPSRHTRQIRMSPAPNTQADDAPVWLYADNGFASASAMDELHRPLVTLAREALGGGGNVLDLGCGNGALLNKICEGRDDLVPYGVDSNADALAHARQLLPRFADNFVHGDLFDTESWAAGKRRYALALLMLGRLLEVPTEDATRVLDQLRLSCSCVLAYVYPDWGEQPLAAIARRFGLNAEESADGTAVILKWLHSEEETR